MHSVGEKIMYGGAGLMEIVDVREESFGDLPRKYYVLHDLRSTSDSQTFVPVDNDKLTAAMHPLLTKEEACDLMSRIADIPLLECNSDNRIRSEKFKSIIESDDREALISLIKTVNEINRRRREEGKKSSLADDSALKKAEKLIYAEFSEVLGLTEAEIAEIIG